MYPVRLAVRGRTHLLVVVVVVVEARARVGCAEATCAPTRVEELVSGGGGLLVKVKVKVFRFVFALAAAAVACGLLSGVMLSGGY